MVSGEKVWDPLHAGPLQTQLTEQHLATELPALGDLVHVAHQNAACHQSLHSPPSSSVPSAVVGVDTLHLEQISFPGTRGSLPDSFCPARCGSGGARGLNELRLGVASQPDAGEEGAQAERQGMKGKSKQGGRGEAMIEDRLEDMADGPKNAKITLSFPLSAGPLPASLTSPNHRRNSSSSSPSPHRRRPSSGSKASDDGSLWKLDATMDIKHRPFKPPRHDSSPSSSPSSSSSPMTVNSFIKKDIKTPAPLKCSKVNPETPFNRFPHNRSSGGSLVGGYEAGEGWEERHRVTNGTVSPSQTAQILFNLGTSSVFQGQRGREDVERTEKTNRKHSGKAQCLHGPNLQPPTLHLPAPLPPSEAFTAPQHPSSLSPAEDPKPELICGVCHRLFSSASSLTVHMRLHRGSRGLSCRYCGKAFIHSKRLQSHETSCRAPGLASNSPGPPSSLSVRPKEEPLEEGEVRVEGGVVVGTEGAIDSGKVRPGKKARSLLARIQADDVAASELLAGDEHHFVKVVDGNVIYFCSVCERSYMTLSSLKRHSNVHSWRRKYPCHFCDKVFALAEYRTKHEVWHTGERRYQCIFCWDAFATYYNLKTHQKTIHGINPSLISSEKTANGGYKQKVNALKLYRLLPMRSQKRAYKTYSDSLSNGLLLPPAEASSIAVPQGLDCTLGPEDLQSLINGAHAQSVKPDPDAFPNDFPVSVTMEHRDFPTLASLPATDLPQVRKHDTEAPELEQGRVSGSFKLSSSSKTKSHKDGRGTGTSPSSVISYAQTKPSVIVHGTGISSSVIVHCNQVTPGNGKTLVSSLPAEGSDILASHKARSNKKQRESTERHRKRSRDSLDDTGQSFRGRQDTELGRSHHKARKLHSKGDISAAKHLSSIGGAQAKDAGPLCQITVRIGEEAIVKRSISETDLRRDKSRSPPKTKRTESSSAQDAKDTRHPHSHHHHHKHRAHCNASLGAEQEPKGDRGPGGEGDSRKNICKSPAEVREYYFRQEVREHGESDNDAEDNLWRPYYSYKPKRKAQAHLQRAKNWQRRLQYKRSLRLMRRAERLMNHVSKETDKLPDEEEDGKMEELDKEELEGDREEVVESEKESKGDVEKEKQKIKEHLSFPPKQKTKVRKEHTEEAQAEASISPVCSPMPPLSTSASSQGIKRRPWTNGNAAECSTCGRWFSSARKRDKHELSHLLEFVCLFCRATFPSRDKLEDHQRAQHPKPNDTPSVPHKVGLNEQGEGISVGDGAKYLAEREEETKEGGVGPLLRTNSSPSCLSRRALARHTCPQCHKVCKTSSALTRHIRRHELSSSPEREEIRSEPKAAETMVKCDSKEPEGDKEQVPTALSVSVISYSLPDPTSAGSSQQCESHCSELQIERQICESLDKTEFNELDHPVPKRESSPRTTNSSLNSQVNLTPTRLESTPAPPSTLHSVLVMNGPECLDYRTTKRKTLEGHIHRMPSPVCVMTPSSTSPNVPMTLQTRITTATPPVSMTTAPPPEVGLLKREGVIMDRERQGVTSKFLHASYEEPTSIHNLRVPFMSPRSPSPNEAQDLTMSSILAREREMQRQREREMERHRVRERAREAEKGREYENECAERIHGPVQLPQEGVALLVPKEEPLSPAPSPQHTPTPTTVNVAPSPRSIPKSPRRSPNHMNLLARVRRQANHPLPGIDRPQLLSGAAGASDRPSAHALLLPRAPPHPEPERQGTPASRRGEDPPPVSYPMQDLPLPLIMPAGYRSGKKQEEELLMSPYPAGALPFGPLGKVMVPNGGDLAKLPFYPDPYQLLYGPQLLAYPYNLAALPVALNMMAPGGDKMEPLPFLPAIFNYAATAGPYMGAAPHPLVANPSLYGSSAGGGGVKKQRDGGGSKP